MRAAHSPSPPYNSEAGAAALSPTLPGLCAAKPPLEVQGVGKNGHSPYFHLSPYNSKAGAAALPLSDRPSSGEAASGGTGREKKRA